METEIPKSPSDEIIENAKKSEELGSTSFMDPQPKEGPKRKGRPPKDKSKVFTEKTDTKDSKASQDTSGPAFNIPTKQLCYLPAKAVSAWGVSYVGDPKAAMTPDDLEAFATGLGLVIDKHLPDAMKNYGPEMMFAMALTQYGVRIMAMKKLKTQHMNKQPNTVQNQPSHRMADQPKKEPDSVHLVETQEETTIP